MGVCRPVLLLLLLTSISLASADPVRLDLLAEFEATRATVPAVYWAENRVCVPSREGSLCYDVGPIPRPEPVRRSVVKGSRPFRGKVKLSIGGGVVLIDSSKETIETLPDGGTRSFRDSCCPMSSASFREWLVVTGPKAGQVALLRREKYRRHSECPEGAADCQLDEFSESWSVLIPTVQCEAP